MKVANLSCIFFQLQPWLIDISSGSWVYTFQFITNKSCYIMKVNGATLFLLILGGRADGVWIKWSHLPNGVLLFLFSKIWKKVLKREIFGNVENRFVTHSKHAISDCPKPNIVFFLPAAESDIFRYNTFFTTAYIHTYSFHVTCLPEAREVFIPL